MKLFKKLRTNYYELWDYIDESQAAFINKKGKLVAIVEMCNPLSYSILKLFYNETNDVDLTKEDFFRLYPRRAKKLTFSEMPSIECNDKTKTLEYYLKTDFKC